MTIKLIINASITIGIIIVFMQWALTHAYTHDIM